MVFVVYVSAFPTQATKRQLEYVSKAAKESILQVISSDLIYPKLTMINGFNTIGGIVKLDLFLSVLPCPKRDTTYKLSPTLTPTLDTSSRNMFIYDANI